MKGKVQKLYLRRAVSPLLVVIVALVVTLLLTGREIGWLVAAITTALPAWSLWVLLVYAHYYAVGRKKLLHESD
ncbi:hypothetical protein [Qipengyuania aquimaris]|uniref:hypothetical protein n=1 Tax=Qipengyuania aquimaris TaxID=255984 RepID=UPI001CD49C72|nr:hypothetical protein [Qipengyuania aquimaris]MCA0904309.1 hypothetical protein [Qipengyuania aquimaris]